MVGQSTSAVQSGQFSPTPSCPTPTGAEALALVDYRGPISLVNIDCEGTESSLTDCRNTGPGPYCFRQGSAAAICSLGI